MSASDSEDGQPRRPPELVGTLKTERTFDTGSSTASAKNTLKDIARRKLIIPKGTYAYRKLASDDEIRILRIQPGRYGDQIRCTLIPSALPPSGHRRPVSTADVYPYEALSYWWGDDDARNKIMIQSYNAAGASSRETFLNVDSGSFYIRSNLEAALQQLRHGEKTVNLWVDALCIDQNNQQEKTTQVLRMHEIYSGATNVCIWLGAGKPESKETFDFLRDILDLDHLDQLVKSGATPVKWQLVVGLLENRWFSRRWVVQELALARNASVRWGEQEMQWSDFADAIALFMTRHDEIKQILTESAKYPTIKDPFGDARALGANTLVNATNNLIRKSTDGEIQQRLLTLEVLVSCLLLAFEASDPRDTIYAVLSIAKDTSFAVSDMMATPSWLIASQPRSNNIFGKLITFILSCLLRIIYCCIFLIQFVYGHMFSTGDGSQCPPTPDTRISPNYSKNLTDVCADFMDYCIETSQSLDILCRHWAPTPRKKEALEELKSQEKSTKEKMPTWIPSITGHAFGSPEQALQGRCNGDSFVGSLERQNQQTYNASAGLPPWVKFGRCKCAENPSQPSPGASRKYDGTLSVKGYRLNQITKLSGRVSGGMIQKEALEMGDWPREEKKVPDPLWRTLVADRGPSGTNAPSWYHRACLECFSHVNQNGDLDTESLKNAKGTPSTIVAFLERVQRVIWNRRFFKAEGIMRRRPRPLFGLAPPGAGDGDWICIIYGCSVPVLLRESDGNTFEFIGECYVHGMMDGEAIPKSRPKFPYHESDKFKLL